VTPRAYLRTLLLAAALGVPASFAAVLFQTVLHDLTDLVWDELPEASGWDAPPSWYVLLVLGVAGLLVAGALRLPGGGGHTPLEGLGLGTIHPIDLLSILPAALATLALGLVLGPEAPLIALGLSIGVAAVRIAGSGEEEGRLLVLAGAFAALAGLFGGPLPAAFLFFEVLAVSGKVPAGDIGRALVPGFVAAATGAVVYTGVGGWPGLDAPSLALPMLPDYPTVRVVDVAWCLPVAAAVAVIVAAFHRGAGLVAARAGTPRVATLVVAGLAVGGLAVAFRVLADRPVELVLFSGQTSLPAVVAEGSAGVLALLVMAKGAAYALSLASGFRGGPVFPAIVLGVAFGVLAALVLPGFDLVPGIVAGVAASTAAVLLMPFFAVVVATLLAGSAAVDTTPIAILSAVVGWLVATAFRKP
jgi:chloride channel protein, CIC family